MSEIDSDLVLKRWKPTDPKRPPGQYSVRCEGARGLSVKMHKSGTITWVFRFKQHDKQRQMTLGPYPAIPLSAAREAARVAYAHVKAGRDPIEIKRTEEAETIAAKRRKRTFADAVEDYMESGRLKALKTDKLRAQRRYVLETYAVPIIGKLFVDEITDEDVQQVLSPIWRDKPATADKVLQYMSGVFGNSIALKQRTASNPATRKALGDWIDAQGQRETRHHAALSIDDAPEWFAALGERDGMGALALKFVALTAARVGMVRGMSWGEIRNFEQRRVWTIPASRMKSSRRKSDRAERPKPFRVPLSDAAIDLLKGLEQRENVSLVLQHREYNLSPEHAAALARHRRQTDREISRLEKIAPGSSYQALLAGTLDVPQMPVALRTALGLVDAPTITEDMDTGQAAALWSEFALGTDQ